MAEILITGASGFIGSNLTRELVKTQNKISILTRNEKELWRLKDIASDIVIYKADISNRNAVKNLINKCKPDILYHCASYGVMRRHADANKILKTNIDGTRNLLIAIEEYGNIDKFVNVGSYLEKPFEFDNKDLKLNKQFDLYGLSKFYQTKLIEYYSVERKIPAVTLRLYNPYGQFEDSSRLVSHIMVSLVLKKSLKINSGSARHNFIYIKDVVNALKQAPKWPNKNGGIIDIRTAIKTSVKEVVELACELANSKLKIQWDGDKISAPKKNDAKETVAGHFDEKLNWKPEVSLEKGLQETFNWYKKNISFYKNIK